MTPAEKVKIAEERADRGEISRQRLYQIRRRAEGNCASCGKPAVSAGQCEQHRVSANESNKRRGQTQRDARALAEGRTPGYRRGPRPELRGPKPAARHPKICGACGEQGHNRRTCARRAA